MPFYIQGLDITIGEFQIQSVKSGLTRKQVTTTLTLPGTRIPVSVILEQVAENESWDDILAGYPELTREDIQASLVLCQGIS